MVAHGYQTVCLMGSERAECESGRTETRMFEWVGENTGYDAGKGCESRELLVVMLKYCAL